MKLFKVKYFLTQIKEILFNATWNMDTRMPWNNCLVPVKLQYYNTAKGVARGGVMGCPWTPFVSLFVSKKPTIFRWQPGGYPLYFWPPPLWKILATPLQIKSNFDFLKTFETNFVQGFFALFVKSKLPGLTTRRVKAASEEGEGFGWKFEVDKYFGGTSIKDRFKHNYDNISK